MRRICLSAWKRVTQAVEDRGRGARVSQEERRKEHLAQRFVERLTLHDQVLEELYLQIVPSKRRSWAVCDGGRVAQSRQPSAAFVAEGGQRRKVGGDMLATLGYVMNWRLIAQGDEYFGDQGAASPLQHAWTLAIEEQFYVVWPLLILGILPLARHFLPAGRRLRRDAEQVLLRHRWPGNVRELRNVVQRAALLSADDDIGSAALGLPDAAPAAVAAMDPDRTQIEAAIERAGGVLAQAAAELGISRQALYRRMDKLGLRPD